MNASVSLQVEKTALFQNLRHAFSAGAVLGELLQNARRAGATQVSVSFDAGTKTITVEDDGIGISDLQDLLTAAKSGWEEETKHTEHPFGLGFLSTLYVCTAIEIDTAGEAGSFSLHAKTADLLDGKSVAVKAGARARGTMVKMLKTEGIPGSGAVQNFEDQLDLLVKGFPIPVTLNGVELSRPNAMDQRAGWVETDVGQMSINLQKPNVGLDLYLQGLPIGDSGRWRTNHIVHLNGKFMGKLPDRQYLVNHREADERIKRALHDMVYRMFEDEKAAMSAEDFVAKYWQSVMDWGCGSLLCDMEVVPVRLFIDWENSRPGYDYQGDIQHNMESWQGKNVITRMELESSKGHRVFDLPEPEYGGVDTFAAQAWLEERMEWTLNAKLPDGHWLGKIAKAITDSDVEVSINGVGGSEAVWPWGDTVSAVGVAESITITRTETGEESTVDMAVLDSTIYVTKKAQHVPYAASRLCSDYINDDEYDEEQEDRDQRMLEAAYQRLIAGSPAALVRGVVSRVGGLTNQPMLAGRTVILTFDSNGTLKEVRDDQQADQGLRYYAVTGRVPGDDEDVTHIYQAESRDHAVEQFKDALWSGQSEEDRASMEKSEGTDTYINTVIVSDSPLSDAA